MKLKLLPLLLLFFLNNSITAQTWSKDYLANVGQNGLGAINFDYKPNLGGLIYTGLSYTHDYYIKINAAGDTVWVKQNLMTDTSNGLFRPPATPPSIAILTNGDIILSCYTEDTDYYWNMELLVRKIDANGNILSSTSTPVLQFGADPKILADNNGGYYSLYNNDSMYSVIYNGGLPINMTAVRLYIQRYDANNTLQWQHLFHYDADLSQCGFGGGTDTKDARLTYDGGIVYGKQYDTSWFPAGQIEKLHPDGSLDWDINVPQMMNIPNIEYADAYYFFTTSDSCIVTSGTIIPLQAMA